MLDIDGRTFLITGGASLIGSHLADALLAAGAREVRLLDNLSLGSMEAVAHLVAEPRVRFVKGDILRLNEVIDAMSGVHGVFALAAFLTLPLSQNAPLGVDVNVRGMLNSLEAARICKVQKMVFSSSLSVYGNSTTGRIIEEMPYISAGLTPASAIYSASKLLGEALGSFYASRGEPDFASLRFSTVYGERQHARAVNSVFIAGAYDSIAAGNRPKIVGDGSEVHDYIYVTDVADACVAAMRMGGGGETFNIGTGIDTSLTRVVDLVIRACGTKGIEPEYVTDTRTVRSSILTTIGFSPEKAERLLSWRPKVDIEEGIARYVAWRRHGKLAA